jgi:hypothetical protein
MKRSGDTVGFSFDALNRPTEKTVPSPGQDAFYSYDLVSRLTSANFGSPTGAGVSYTYDALSRKLTETAGGLTLTSAYDAAGDRTQLTWPDGFYVNYAFDYLQRPIQATGDGIVTPLANYVTGNPVT